MPVNNDITIYRGMRGRMVKVSDARLPGHANFVITWNGMDWSGFRTLFECEKQFQEIESRTGGCNAFAVVER